MPLTISANPMLQNALCSHTLHLSHTITCLSQAEDILLHELGNRIRLRSLRSLTLVRRSRCPKPGPTLLIKMAGKPILYLWVHQEKIGVFHCYLRSPRKYGVNKVNEMCLCKKNSFESVQVSSSLVRMMQAGGIHLLKKWNQICYARLKQPSWRHFVRFIPSFLGYLIHSD